MPWCENGEVEFVFFFFFFFYLGQGIGLGFRFVRGDGEVVVAGTVGFVLMGVVVVVVLVVHAVRGGVVGGVVVVDFFLGSSVASEVGVEGEVVACIGGHEAAHCRLRCWGA